VVVAAAAQQSGHGVRAEEVHQVRGAAQGRRLHGGHAAETEVVELKTRTTWTGAENNICEIDWNSAKDFIKN